MEELKRTVLYDEHIKLGGKMIDFGGWEMPVNYPAGIVKEHVATREGAGLFDVSHMGRFKISGTDAIPFLQYSLTNNAEKLELGKAQYTIIQNDAGGAVDDAYLYRFDDSGYILVVNASNREKDMTHLDALKEGFDVVIEDVSDNEGMIALQGSDSVDILVKASDESDLNIRERLTYMKRNDIGSIRIAEINIDLSRTGYTGEKVGFELFIPVDKTPKIWSKLMDLGSVPAGLGARDTLRLEANMPLYGHELGIMENGYDIPIFTGPLAKFAVSFDDAKGDFYGKEALTKSADNPGKRVFPFELKGKGIPRAGYEVMKDGKQIGVVTSGTMLPDKRAIGLALLNVDNVEIDDEIYIMIRNKEVPAVITKSNLKIK